MTPLTDEEETSRLDQINKSHTLGEVHTHVVTQNVSLTF